MASKIKNIALLPVLLIFFSFSIGQGNLQFNKAIFRTFDTNYLGETYSSAISFERNIYDTVLLVVPSDKVVKIEYVSSSTNNAKQLTNDCLPYLSYGDSLSASGHEYNNIGYGAYEASMYLNGSIIRQIGIANSYGKNDTDSPIWLPSGSYVFTLVTAKVIQGFCSSTGLSYTLPMQVKGFISGIEFNIVP